MSLNFLCMFKPGYRAGRIGWRKFLLVKTVVFDGKMMGDASTTKRIKFERRNEGQSSADGEKLVGEGERLVGDGETGKSGGLSGLSGTGGSGGSGGSGLNVVKSVQEMMKDMVNRTKVWKPIVWIDCEMTGLDVFKDHIIEICCIVTDGHLNVVDEKGYESTIYYPTKILDTMNEWCVEQHGKSGLTAKVLANPGRKLGDVEKELLDYVKRYTEPGKGIMAGNSIHMDKMFMMREFPLVVNHLHYRLIDVSSIMEVGFRHNPELMNLCPKKQGTHTAKSDILESIEQLRWYRKHYLKDEDECKDLIETARKLDGEVADVQ